MDAEWHRNMNLSQTWYVHPNKTICCSEDKCDAVPSLVGFQELARAQQIQHCVAPHKWKRFVAAPLGMIIILGLPADQNRFHVFVAQIGLHWVTLWSLCTLLPKIICNTAMRGSFHYLGTWQHLVLHEIWVQVLPHLCLGKHFQMLLKDLSIHRVQI